MAEVEYLDVDGFPGYRVGSDGSVWSCFRRGAVGQRRTLDGEWKRLNAQPSKKGYLVVTFYRNACASRVSVHRLVLNAFVGPCPPGCEGCHWDGDPSNNAVTNLRWGTHADNRADRTRHGRARSWSKVTAAQVAELKRSRVSGHTYAAIGAAYGISASQASNIIRGKQWKGEPDPHRVGEA